MLHSKRVIPDKYGCIKSFEDMAGQYVLQEK